MTALFSEEADAAAVAKEGVADAGFAAFRNSRSKSAKAEANDETEVVEAGNLVLGSGS